MPSALQSFLLRLAAALTALGCLGAFGADTLVIPGAGPPEAPLRALAAAYMKANPGQQVSVPPSTGIAGGIRAVTQNEAVLARIARRLRDEESRAGLKQIVLASDAVVFAVGSQVSVSSITPEQVIEVFAGRIVNWRSLGGEPGPVRVLVREPTEIAHQTIRRHLPGFDAIDFTDHAKLVNADFEMVESLDRFRTAIGWMTRSSLALSKTGVRALALDGVAPTPENIATRRYAMVVDHVLIFREDRLNDAARRFIAFVQSEAGREILRSHGVVPLGGKP